MFLDDIFERAAQDHPSHSSIRIACAYTTIETGGWVLTGGILTFASGQEWLTYEPAKAGGQLFTGGAASFTGNLVSIFRPSNFASSNYSVEIPNGSFVPHVHEALSTVYGAVGQVFVSLAFNAYWAQ